MKILLVAVNAKYIHSNLAVYSLKKAAERPAGEVEIAEYTINQQFFDILSDIYRRQPDVVAFSCYIWNRLMVEELMGELPKVLPGVRIWAGGPEVSFDAETFLEEHPEVTGIMRGEGEGIFRELASYYIEGTGTLDDIRGLTFRDLSGNIRQNPPAALLDPDEVPFPYDDLEKFAHKIIYYESSRGCPFRCSYCLSSVDRHLRFRSLDLVKEELGRFLEARIPQVKFVDRTFNCNPGRTAELWRWMMEHDNGITNFHFEIAADLITEEELELMSRMRPGLIQLEIGVQSVNPATIREIDRVMDLERLKTVVERVRSRGNIHQHLDLIAGLPEEDLDSFRRSYNEVFAMKPEQLQLGFLKVLEGTKMKARAERYGILCRKNPPYEVYATSWLSFGEVLLLKGVEEMTEIYYNSHQFDRTLAEILKRKVSPFDFFHELAVYYDEKGLADVSHGRMARYEILRDFLREKGCWSAEADQCMVFDLYARERLKSRPVFAADLTPYRERLKEYERAYGRKVHIEVFEKEHGPEFVLFDYDRRSPLTKEAYTEVLR